MSRQTSPASTCSVVVGLLPASQPGALCGESNHGRQAATHPTTRMSRDRTLAVAIKFSTDFVSNCTIRPGALIILARSLGCLRLQALRLTRRLYGSRQFVRYFRRYADSTSYDILMDDLYYSCWHNEILRESNGSDKCLYLAVPS